MRYSAIIELRSGLQNLTVTEISFLILLAAAYLAGSLPVGYLISRWWAGIDIRKYGTGNPGAANIYRNIGLTPAALVAVFNYLQGAGPVAVGRALGLTDGQVALVGLAAMAGYGWPVMLGFSGGRGVAITIGVLSGFALWPVAVMVALFALSAAMRRMAGAIFLVFLTMPFYLYLAGWDQPTIAIFGLAFIYLMVRRLWGVWDDLEYRRGIFPLIAQRMVFDARPGQRLVGLSPDIMTNEASSESL